jgi:hypothetical protein
MDSAVWRGSGVGDGPLPGVAVPPGPSDLPRCSDWAECGQREIAPMADPMKENRPRFRRVNFFDLRLVNQR